MATQGARAAAAAVHLVTATGAVLALLMVHFSYHGKVETVLWLFLVALFILRSRTFEVMNQPVDLDNELGGRAVEVGNEGTDGILTAEANARWRSL